MLDEDDRIFMVLKGAAQSQRDVEYSMSTDREKINIQNLNSVNFDLYMIQPYISNYLG